MSCSPTDNLNPQTYNDACVLAASASNDVINVFTGCCDSATAPVTVTNCYVSCNSTNLDIGLCFGIGVQTLTPSVTTYQEDFACFLANYSSSASTSSSSPSGSPTAGSNPTSSAKSTSPSGTASGTSSPSASSKQSKASASGSISLSAMAIIGLAIFGLLL